LLHTPNVARFQASEHVGLLRRCAALKCTRRVTLHRGIRRPGDWSWEEDAGARGKVKPAINTHAPTETRPAHMGHGNREDY
jgi:hypothetical protein